MADRAARVAGGTAPAGSGGVDRANYPKGESERIEEENKFR